MDIFLLQYNCFNNYDTIQKEINSPPIVPIKE